MAADITYRLATPKDCDLVLELLRDHFYPEEPLTIACVPPLPERYDEDDNRLLILNDYETCIVATSNEQIVGTFLSSKKGPDEENLLLEEAANFPGTKWAKMMMFLAAVERESNVYKRYKVDRAVHGHVLAVHKGFRGNRIGLNLLQKSIERAKELGYQLFTTDCTSVHSARLCERLGMDCVNVSSLADYRIAGSDKQVFFPPGEHKFVKTYAKRLQ